MRRFSPFPSFLGELPLGLVELALGEVRHQLHVRSHGGLRHPRLREAAVDVVEGRLELVLEPGTSVGVVPRDLFEARLPSAALRGEALLGQRRAGARAPAQVNVEITFVCCNSLVNTVKSPEAVYTTS